MNKFGVMGNVNGREDGSTGGGGSSGVDEDGGAPDEMGGAPPPHGDGGELMGQSPPSSPRAAQSPLMFTPQVCSFSSFFPPVPISDCKDLFFLVLI